MAGVRAGVVRTKDQNQSYHLYRRQDFNMDICRYVYCAPESVFEDMVTTLITCDEMDETTAILGFEDGTSAEKICSDLESFLRHVTRDSAVVGLDLMFLFKSEDEQEMLNVMTALNDYMLSHWNKKHVLIPPIVSPSEMGALDKLEKVQIKVNSLNMEFETPPVFPFAWLMKTNRAGSLVHVDSNWVDDGKVISKAGSKKYLQCILRYLKYSINEGLLDYHDCTSRIARPEEGGQGNAGGRGRGRGGHGRGRGGHGRGRGGHGRGRGLARGRIGRYRGSNRGRGGSNCDQRSDTDLRVTIAKQRVKREIERLKALLVEAATRRHLQDFFADVAGIADLPKK